jgi:hypothetical protein
LSADDFGHHSHPDSHTPASSTSLNHPVVVGPVPVGSSLVRSFGELGDFEGEVVRVSEHLADHDDDECKGVSYFYLVRYSDGDEEELEDAELRGFVADYNSRYEEF